MLLLLRPAGMCGLATATRRMPNLIRLVGAAVCLNAAASAAELRLASPLACGPAEGCSIQNYVDAEPGPGVQDFACGVLSYDGHRGTDFQVPDLKRMRRGVPVLAAASGVVRDVRDGRLTPRAAKPTARSATWSHSITGPAGPPSMAIFAKAA